MHSARREVREEGRDHAQMPRDDPDYIESVSKAFQVIEAFSSEHPALTISEAAALTGLTRPTVRRILLTLVRLGFARPSDNKTFVLTPQMMRLGYAYLSSTPVWDHAMPHLRDLADSVRESVSLAVLDLPEIVYVARVPAARSMTITLTVGARLPAYPTSLGRVLLAALSPAELADHLRTTELVKLTPSTIVDPDELVAELDRVRRQGFAIIDGEREIGVRSAAVPVRDHRGNTIMALNVSANAARMTVKTLEKEVVPQLLRVADTISMDGRFTHHHA
jgi:IclR family pca regulon transcriptional regulator